MGDDRQLHGTFGWSQLLTTAPAEAAAFYQALLGWTVERETLEGVEQLLMFNGDEAVASILGMPGQSMEAMSHWHPHLNVDDVDLCVERALELGGRMVVPPGDIPDLGRLSVIQDPTGAVITLVGPFQEPLEDDGEAAFKQDGEGDDASGAGRLLADDA